jgi:hypothetical protein
MRDERERERLEFDQNAYGRTIINHHHHQICTIHLDIEVPYAALTHPTHCNRLYKSVHDVATSPIVVVVGLQPVLLLRPRLPVAVMMMMRLSLCLRMVLAKVVEYLVMVGSEPS